MLKTIIKFTYMNERLRALEGKQTLTHGRSKGKNQSSRQNYRKSWANWTASNILHLEKLPLNPQTHISVA